MQILSQYIKMTLSDSTSYSHAVTDIETLAVVKSLHAIVGKQFISTVTPEDLIGACIPRAANAVS